jgi:hypothetical protein
VGGGLLEPLHQCYLCAVTCQGGVNGDRSTGLAEKDPLHLSLLSCYLCIVNCKDGVDKDRRTGLGRISSNSSLTVISVLSPLTCQDADDWKRRIWLSSHTHMSTLLSLCCHLPVWSRYIRGGVPKGGGPCYGVRAT